VTVFLTITLVVEFAIDFLYGRRLTFSLILQFPLLAQTATAVACLGHLLVPAPPTGPEDDPRWRMLRRPHEAYQEPPDFRDGEGEVLWTGQRPLRPMLPALPGPG
jgi:hypothetical protein